MSVISRTAPACWPALLPHLKALRVLLAVARHGSTTAAAQAVHISQPAITRAVALLEAACGQALFIRTSRGMLPTAHGGQLAGRAEALFEQLRTGAHEAMTGDLQRPMRTHVAERFAQSVTPSQLAALLAVTDSGSESLAAARLGITQPAVHASLQALERLLGARLFHKLPTGTRLTPSAEPLLRYAKQAMAELRGMDSDMAAWHGQPRGRITVGVLPLSVPIFLPRATAALLRQHPAVQVRIIDGTYESLMERLLCAEIDAIAGALRDDASAPQLRQLELFEDDLVIIAHRDHPCMRQRGLQLRDLLQWPWVAPLPDTPADRVLRSIFAQHGLPPPDGQLCAGSPVMTQAFVQQGGLLAMASRGQALLDGAGGPVRVVPVPLPATSRRIGIVTRAATTPAPELRAFLLACRTAVP